jgi:hypothetical protein
VTPPTEEARDRPLTHLLFQSVLSSHYFGKLLETKEKKRSTKPNTILNP